MQPTSILKTEVAEAAETPVKERTSLSSKEDFVAYIEKEAPKYGVSPAKVIKVVDCETGGTWNPEIVGDQGRSYGLSQIFLPGHPKITKEMATSPRYALDYIIQNWNKDKWTCQKYL